jgi:hypothetical protein
MLLRNVGWLSTDYKALYPRRYNSSQKYFVLTLNLATPSKRSIKTLKKHSTEDNIWPYYEVNQKGNGENFITSSLMDSKLSTLSIVMIMHKVHGRCSMLMGNTKICQQEVSWDTSSKRFWGYTRKLDQTKLEYNPMVGFCSKWWTVPMESTL